MPAAAAVVLADLRAPTGGALVGLLAIAVIMWLNRRPDEWWQPRPGDGGHRPTRHHVPRFRRRIDLDGVPEAWRDPAPIRGDIRRPPGRPPGRRPVTAGPRRDAMPPRPWLSPRYIAYINGEAPGDDGVYWPDRTARWGHGRCELGIVCRGIAPGTEFDHKHYRTLFHERRADVADVCHPCHIRREELKDHGVNVYDPATWGTPAR
jgi:hypothetical protein